MSETMGELIERHQKEFKVRATSHGDSHRDALHPTAALVPTINSGLSRSSHTLLHTHAHTHPSYPKSVQNKGKKMLKKVPRGDFEAR